MKSCRYWDIAGTVDGNYTAGVRIDRRGHTYYVVDVIRGRWTPGNRDAVMLRAAKNDGKQTVVGIEKQPGAVGISLASHFARLFVGYVIRHDRPSGPKDVRAEAFTAQAEGWSYIPAARSSASARSIDRCRCPGVLPVADGRALWSVQRVTNRAYASRVLYRLPPTR